jgi:hypothetical protein
VAKVVRVVEALTEHAGVSEITGWSPVGVSEISRRTGLPTSTVHWIIQELVALGWVRSDGDHGYLPGVRLLTRAARAESESLMTSIVNPCSNGYATPPPLHRGHHQGSPRHARRRYQHVSDGVRDRPEAHPRRMHH